MDDSSLKNKICELENRINKLEQSNSAEDDENSVISFILDIFNIRRLLETMLYSQKWLKITKNFVNVLLLLIFLTFVFWETGTFKFEISPVTTTLMSICLIGLVEIAGANRWILKNRFTREARAKKFFDNLNSMKSKDIKAEMKTQKFSSNCINYLFRKIEKNDTEYPLYLINLIIENQYLDQNNLNLLFSSKFFKAIDENTIKKLLIYKRELLTPENIQTIYETFEDEDDIVKILVASQYSRFLIKKYPENKRLTSYYENYHLKNEHLTWKLKIFRAPLPVIKKIESFFDVVIFFLLIIYYLSTAFTPSTTYENITQFISIITASSFVTFIFDLLLFNQPYKFFYKKYTNTFIDNVTKNK